jgi:hypothetical protein
MVVDVFANPPRGSVKRAAILKSALLASKIHHLMGSSAGDD